MGNVAHAGVEWGVVDCCLYNYVRKVHFRLCVIVFFFFKQKTAYEISACLVGSEMCIRDRTTRVSLYSPGCPGTHFVDQVGLELRNPPASAPP